MKNTELEYCFSGKIWYSCWYFVSLPKEMAKDIRGKFKHCEEGWGRLKATAKIGGSKWKTAIWFDTKQQSYFLPVKAEIRKKEKIGAGHEVQVALYFEA